MNIHSDTRILLAVNDQHFGAAIGATLHAADFVVTRIVRLTEHLPASLRQTESDLLIIHGTRWDEKMRQRITGVMDESPVPIVYLMHPDHCEGVEAAVRSGVAACIVAGPEDGLRWRPAIAAAVAHFEIQRDLRFNLHRIRAELDDRKDVDRAKGVLMNRRQLSEPEAYRLLQKLAMDSKRRIGEVARDLLA